MLFKIKSNPKHPLSCALPLPYVPASVTPGALVAHRHSFSPPRCRTSQYRRTFLSLSDSLWNDLSDPVFDGNSNSNSSTSFCLRSSSCRTDLSIHLSAKLAYN